MEKLKKGDSVWSLGLDGKPSLGLVLNTMSFVRDRIYRVKVKGQDAVRVSAEHPFFVVDYNDYVVVRDLKPGLHVKVMQRMKTANGKLRSPLPVVESRVIESVEVDSDAKTAVYNIEVAGNHNYFAGGILVHNKKQTQTWENPCQPCYDGCGWPPVIPPLQEECIGLCIQQSGCDKGGF